MFFYTLLFLLSGISFFPHSQTEQHHIQISNSKKLGLQFLNIAL